ncbi:MAG: hypothetical protein LBT14_03550 [Treponema sp.]|jgi:methyl-accepting chemotaxis protein|nr:hypothetical protein [Treponema sp.]
MRIRRKPSLHSRFTSAKANLGKVAYAAPYIAVRNGQLTTAIPINVYNENISVLVQESQKVMTQSAAATAEITDSIHTIAAHIAKQVSTSSRLACTSIEHTSEGFDALCVEMRHKTIGGIICYVVYP